jgi:hypothetical protein
MKIIKNDIIPKLTPKINKRVQSFRCEKLKKNLIFDNEFFLNFKSPVFFDLQKIYKNAEFNDTIDVVENYIIKHFITLSIILKFKIKLQSSIDVKEIIEDITLMVDENFREYRPTKNVSSYCYFSLSFYLVEIGKVTQTVKLLQKTVNSFSDKKDINTKLKALTSYNLGILQYALGEFKTGIHNLEVAYKLIVEFFLSEKFKHKVMVSLGLAYLNLRNLFKAYVLIQTSIKELKKIRKQKYELKCIKLNVYLNYIIDLYEYSFITKTRLQNKETQRDKNYNIRQLKNCVKGENDKELIVIEQHVAQFLKVVEYIWNLPAKILDELKKDNPAKQLKNYKQEVHNEKNLSFNMEQSQMSTFLGKDNGLEKEENQEELNEDIEIKPELFDALTREQKKDLKELKAVFLKRDIILRDSLGEIEKFNINYDPVYTLQFQKIIEKLKSNFLLKEIFYCFQNEKWRDELYNYSPNNVLFGLSKYLALEKIKNVIAIEKSKCLDIIKKEKEKKETDLLKKLNIENYIYPNTNIPMNNLITLTQNNNISFISKYKNEDMNCNMNYLQFKQKFAEALKDDKNDCKIQYLNLSDDYLVSLYKNVYLNNPESNFIFQNPSLILNYIYIDISSQDTAKKEANELIRQQKIQEEELNYYKNRKSSSFVKINKNNTKEKKEKSVNDSNSGSSYEKNIDSNMSYYEIKVIDKIAFLKFDKLKIVKTDLFSIYFVRKKVRSATSNWTGKIQLTFGAKKKTIERKSFLPELHMNKKLINKKDNSKNKIEFKENSKERSYKKQFTLGKPLNANKNENPFLNKPKKNQIKKKKDKSCRNFHERLSINLDLNEVNDDQKEKKVVP